jgi:hypothetical protein
MRSVPKRYCRRGLNCWHVRHGGSDGPIALGRSHTDDISDRCNYNANDSEVPEEYTELFRTAKALFDNDVEDEDEIIPTLVFVEALCD